MNDLIEITNMSAPELDMYIRLSETELKRIYEPETGIFIAESPKVISRALDSGCIPISILVGHQQSLDASDVIHRCADVPIYSVDMEMLSRIKGFQFTGGLLCAMRRPKLPSVEDLCKNASRIVILEDVVNPTNIGAIFRSAAALGVDAMLLTPACADPLYRRAARVSMGTVFQIPWTFFSTKKEQQRYERLLEGENMRRTHSSPTCIKKEIPSVPSCPMQSVVTQRNEKPDYALSKPLVWPQPAISNLRKKGFSTVALALKDDSISLDNPLLAKLKKLAIVVGTEGDGLAASTIADCDYTVRIPMSHQVDSLNVAAASAVAFWQLCRNKN